MPYEAEISRANPTAIVLLIDQSESMKTYQSGDKAQGRKCDNLAMVINRILNELALRCSKGEEVFDYFEIAMIGYGNLAFGNEMVGTAFGGTLASQRFVRISQIADHPIRVEKRFKQVPDGACGLTKIEIDFPIWLEPVFSASTPMATALIYVYRMLDQWLQNHRNSFPPIIMHITDGLPTDADPRPVAEAIRSLETRDGNVLMFNLHLSDVNAKPIVFPARENLLPDEFAGMLYTMSSLLPQSWYNIAGELGLQVEAGARAFAFNADLTAMIRFLEIGTRQPVQYR